MTYAINDTTTMVLTDIGDTFTVDPMLIFLMNGKEVPVYKAIPQILDIDIQDNPIADVLDVKVTNAVGMISTFTLLDIDAVAAYLVEAAKAPMPNVVVRVTGKPVLTAVPSEPAQEAADSVPVAQVTDDTTPATDAAQAAQDASEAAPEDRVCQYIAKCIRPRARRIVDLCDNCIRLRKENNYAASGSELTNLINTAKLLRLDVAGRSCNRWRQ